jgi:CO/xanthine dehydrogenase Mo-binding subunit
MSSPAAERAAARELPPKADAWAMVTAGVSYLDDLRPPGLVHLAVVRSTIAHGDVAALDLPALRREPDVVDVFGPDEVLAATDPVRPALDPETIGGRRLDLPAMTRRVRHVGQPVAVVVARTRRAARRAAARARVEYSALPAVLSGEDALRRDAPVLYADHGVADNVLARPRFAVGDAAAALATAPHRLDLVVGIPRTTVAPLEPRGYVAAWDADRARLTVQASHQHPFQLRGLLAQALRLGEDQVRVVVPTVGGSFGLKMTGAPEEVLVGLAAMRLSRPVSWVESREECSSAGAREQTHRVQVGFDDDGRLLALRDEALVPVGAMSALPGWRMGYVSAAAFPTGYDIAHVDVSARLVLTNQPPWVSARGWGKEAPVLVMEHALDAVADRLGLDPLVVRRRNLVPPDAMPHRMPSGYSIDSGDFPAALDAAAAQADLAGLRQRRDTSTDPAAVHGVGIAFELTPEGGGHPAGPVGPDAPAVGVAPESARVGLRPDGGAVVHSGVTSPGGGNETAIAGLVAGRLGLRRDRVDVVQGDTDLCPPGTGNASSRAAAVGGAAAVLAADAVLDQCAAALARVRGLPSASVRFADGLFHGPGGPLGDLAEAHRQLAAAGETAATVATREYRPGSPEAGPQRMRPGYPYFSSGAYVAFVRVDLLTGGVQVLSLDAVHDCGTVLEPVLVEGQLHGAMAMGSALALQEQLVDGPDGAPLARTFKEYLVPRANDLPSFTVGHLNNPSPRTLLGAKGGGEAGLGGAQAAVVNAVADAVRRHTGHRPLDLELPMSPPRVRRLLTGSTR